MRPLPRPAWYADGEDLRLFQRRAVIEPIFQCLTLADDGTGSHGKGVGLGEHTLHEVR